LVKFFYGIELRKQFKLLPVGCVAMYLTFANIKLSEYNIRIKLGINL